jgi:hypothetical protein
MFTQRDVKLLLRIRQVLNQRGTGAHTFTIVQHADGVLELIPPPPVERIG